MRLCNHKTSFEANGVVFECILDPNPSKDKLPRYNFTASKHNLELAIGQLFIKNDEIRGLVDIRALKQGEGCGRVVVKALQKLSAEMLIYDIKEQARGFWEKMGYELVIEKGLLMGVARELKVGRDIS